MADLRLEPDLTMRGISIMFVALFVLAFQPAVRLASSPVLLMISATFVSLMPKALAQAAQEAVLRHEIVPF